MSEYNPEIWINDATRVVLARLLIRDAEGKRERERKRKMEESNEIIGRADGRASRVSTLVGIRDRFRPLDKIFSIGATRQIFESRGEHSSAASLRSQRDRIPASVIDQRRCNQNFLITL